MKGLIFFFSNLLLPFFQCSLILRYLAAFLGVKSEKLHSRMGRFVVCFAFFLSGRLIYSIIKPSETIVLIFLCFMIGFSMCFLDGKMKKQLWISLLFTCLIVLNHALATSWVNEALCMNLLSPYHQQEYGVLAVMLIELLMSALEFQVFYNLIGKNATVLRTHEWILLIGVLSLSAIAIFLMQLVFTSSISKPIRISGIAADITVLVMDYITVRLVMSINRYHDTVLENEQLKIQVQYQSQYAETMQQQEKAIRRLRHDFYGTLSVMRSFLDRNQISELSEYLTNYEQAVAEIIIFVRTNQSFLDAVLNTKLTYAKSCGIICSCRIPAELPKFPGIIYCTLMGNLLDNAIEAMVGLESAELQVGIHIENDILVILVRNKVKEAVCQKNPNLFSTKKDSTLHGFGITSVKRIAKQYNGTADFYDDGNWFVARVEMDTRCITK